MKIAITGGTGLIGRSLDSHLRAGGHETVLVSRRLGLDLNDPAGLRQAFEGCEGVAHCAGINREIGSQSYDAVHVRGTENVVRAAREAGVRKLVLVSFLRARPDCGSPYHETKWAAEEIVRASGLEFTVLKPGVVYGRGDHLLDHLSHALHSFPVFPLVGMRACRVRPLAVEDAARILAAGFEDPALAQRTVPVTGPEELSFAGLVRRVAAVVGRRPLVIHVPVWVHYALARVFERAMQVPLVSLAQVRILSEGLVEPAGVWDPLPTHLHPTRAFDPERIRAGLPPAGGFGLRDLRCA